MTTFAPFAMLALLLPVPAHAAGPVVVELFTSQSCSSCPPADALLTELARARPDVLVLSYHVTYWDRLGWKDPYSLPEATARQRRYAAQWPQDGLYTPQLVAQGQRQAVAFDRAAVLAAIGTAQVTPIQLQLTHTSGGIRVAAGPGAGQGTLVLLGYDRSHTTRVGAGENGGRTLTETNIVRSLAPIGPWRGQPVQIDIAAPPGERVAVLLQADDGIILAAAVLSPTPPGS